MAQEDIKSLKSVNNFLNSNLGFSFNEGLEEVLNNVGFSFVARSERLLIRNESNKYFKLDARRRKNAIVEHKRYRDIRKTKYRKYFAKTRLIADFAAKVEFVEGILLIEYDDIDKVLSIMDEVVKIKGKVEKKLGYSLYDIDSHNIIFNEKTGKWKIIDF